MAAHTVQSLRYKASISVGDLFLLFLQDYDFELDSGLRRGAGHTTSVACMVGYDMVKHLRFIYFFVGHLECCGNDVGGMCPHGKKSEVCQKFILGVSAQLKLFFSYRSVDLQIYDFTYYGTRRH